MKHIVAKSFISFVFLLFLATNSLARTWIVPADAPTIQAGIDSAVVGDTVLVRRGTYFEYGIELTPGVNLVGEYPDQPENVVIDGRQLGRIMRCVGYSEEFVIEGVTFTGGLAAGPDPSDQWGGALLADNIRATIRNCVFRGNSALPFGQGGAVFIQDYWSPNFFDCSFDSNSADFGGAVRIRDNARPPFDGCRFSNNYAQSRGGALYIHDWVNVGSAAYFNDCDFVGNHAVLDGGVMFASYGSAEFTSCLFADNFTDYSPYYARGGALYIDINSLRLRSCTFVGNRARVGSAIYAYNVYWLMHNVIVANNICDGGAVYGANFNNTYDFRCNDIHGNPGGDWIGYIAQYLGTDGNISSDPHFCGSGFPDQPYHLQPGSPCLPEQTQCGLIGVSGLGCASSGVGNDFEIPAAPYALKCWPNPFNPVTTVSFEVERTQEIRLAVFDLRGGLVVILADRIFQPGPHEFVWGGRDAAGCALSSGEYFIHLDRCDGSETLKTILLK